MVPIVVLALEWASGELRDYNEVVLEALKQILDSRSKHGAAAVEEGSFEEQVDERLCRRVS